MTHSSPTSHPIQLIALDIDNTLFDWVKYYTACFVPLLSKVSELINVDVAKLASEAKVVFAEEGSIEYPFIIQRLPSVQAHYGSDYDLLIDEAVHLGRKAFVSAAGECLRPYEGVKETLTQLRDRFPEIPLVALTDAPRYVAMWKLNKLGILDRFQAVYGLADPDLPVSFDHKRILVDNELLLKHHLKENFGFRGKIRTLPDEYEKPGVRGLRTVLMDYEYDVDIEISHPKSVLWVGDNLAKDILLGQRLMVSSAWAEYGTHIDPADKELLVSFSPDINVRKNVPLDPADANSPRPDFILQSFRDILEIVEQSYPAQS